MKCRFTKYILAVCCRTCVFVCDCGCVYFWFDEREREHARERGCCHLRSAHVCRCLLISGCAIVYMCVYALLCGHVRV